MQLDIEANKSKFKEIFQGEITRDGSQELLQWIESTDFFVAPYTGQKTLSCKGGACQHALNVFRCATELLAKYREIDPDYLLDPDVVSTSGRDAAIAEVDQSLAISALLAGLYVANSWQECTKNKQNPDGKWVKVPGFMFQEDFIYGCGAKSVFIIQNYMRLYIEEAQAIRFHKQGKEVPFGDTIETIYYDVYDTSAFAAFIGTAVNEANNILDKIIWDSIKPTD